jgi:hypothetical protein
VRGDRRPQILLLAALAFAAMSGCGGDHESSSSSVRRPTSTSSPSATEKPLQKTTTSSAGRRLVRSPTRAAVERTVGRFVEGVELADARLVCRLLGRPTGTLEGCARSAGIDLHAVPSSAELSVARIAFRGSRASAKLSGGQIFALRRAGRRWLISGLRP